MAMIRCRRGRGHGGIMPPSVQVGPDGVLENAILVRFQPAIWFLGLGPILQGVECEGGEFGGGADAHTAFKVSFIAQHRDMVPAPN